MNFEQRNFEESTVFPVADMGCYVQNEYMAPALNGQLFHCGIKPLMPYHGVNFQSSINCPRKFVIFDQTGDRRQVVFNPGINPNFVYPGFGGNPPFVRENVDQINSTDEKNSNCSFKEDSGDINALLSTEYEEQEKCDDYDDDVLSTARTSAYHACNSPDSCSNYEATPSRKNSLFKKSVGDRCDEKKRKRIRKMVKALKGIVPGANRMSTVSVLDEAVRYLKSLRVEVQKLGVRNAKN